MDDGEHMVESSVPSDGQVARKIPAARARRRPDGLHAAADHPPICPGSTPASAQVAFMVLARGRL